MKDFTRASDERVCTFLDVACDTVLSAMIDLEKLGRKDDVVECRAIMTALDSFEARLLDEAGLL